MSLLILFYSFFFTFSILIFEIVSLFDIPAQFFYLVFSFCAFGQFGSWSICWSVCELINNLSVSSCCKKPRVIRCTECCAIVSYEMLRSEIISGAFNVQNVVRTLMFMNSPANYR